MYTARTTRRGHSKRLSGFWSDVIEPWLNTVVFFSPSAPASIVTSTQPRIPSAPPPAPAPTPTISFPELVNAGTSDAARRAALARQGLDPFGNPYSLWAPDTAGASAPAIFNPPSPAPDNVPTLSNTGLIVSGGAFLLALAAAKG